MSYDLLTDRLFGVDAARFSSVFVLLLARTMPLAFLAPWLGSAWAGRALRATVALVLALGLTPLALPGAPELPSAWSSLALSIVREALVGVTFAVAASLPLYALGWTGELLDRWRGFPLDATSAASPGGASPLGALHLLASVVLFVVLGGHRLALAAFTGALVSLPVGGAPDAHDLSAFVLGAARVVTAALELAVAFAAPAVVSFLLLDAVLGLWGRVSPQLQLWMEGMSIRAALGITVALLGLSSLLPRLGPVFVQSIEKAADLLRASP